MDPSCDNAGCELFPNDNAKVGRRSRRACSWCACVRTWAGAHKCACLPKQTGHWRHPTPSPCLLLTASDSTCSFHLLLLHPLLPTASDSTCSFHLLLAPPAPSHYSPPAAGCGQVPGLCAEAGGGALRHLLRLHPLDAGGCSRVGGLVGTSWLGRGARWGVWECGAACADACCSRRLLLSRCAAPLSGWVQRPPAPWQRTCRLCVRRTPCPWTSSMSGSTARPPASRLTCLVSGEAAAAHWAGWARWADTEHSEPPLAAPFTHAKHLSAAQRRAGTHHLRLCLPVAPLTGSLHRLPPLCPLRSRQPD